MYSTMQQVVEAHVTYPYKYVNTKVSALLSQTIKFRILAGSLQNLYLKQHWQQCVTKENCYAKNWTTWHQCNLSYIEFYAASENGEAVLILPLCFLTKPLAI